MDAEIIAVGSELLLGQIANTNAQSLSSALAEQGVNVYHHTVVGDNPLRLKRAIKMAEKRAQLIIITGGLGPTKDDLTKEVIAEHLGKELYLDENAFDKIKTYFIKINKQMTPNNKKQAMVIRDSHILPNEHGMAPGMVINDNEKMYMLLPGPPKELGPMFKKYGQPAIEKNLRVKEKIASRVLRFFGIGEAQLETEIADLIEQQSNPTIAPLAGDGDVTIRITAKMRTEQQAEKEIEKVEKEILHRVGQYFYGYDNTTLVNELLKQLKSKNLTIACAESLTGGMFQAEMTAVQGVSSVFLGGIVCYANEIKKNLLHVREETIAKYGAVSEQCAIELAENVRHLLDTDIGISFTGVAGPDSLEGHLPGTIWIGLSCKERPTKGRLIQLSGSRNVNREQAVLYGCYYLLKELKRLGH